MAIDRNAFIQDARQQGYSDDMINSYLRSKGQKEVGAFEKILESQALPIAGATIGGGAGIALSPVTAGASIPFGAAAGYGGGEVIRNSLMDLLGYQKQKPDTQITNAVQGSAAAGTLAETIQMIGSLLSPMKTLGNLRSTVIGNKTVPTADFESKTMENLYNNPYYQNAPATSQVAARSRASSFLENLNPLQTVGQGASMQMQKPENTSINDVYKSLIPFEKMGRAYTQSGETGGTAIGQGTNLSSRAIRDYLNMNIPYAAQKINDIYSALAKFESSPLAKWIPRVGLGYAAYRALPGIINKIKDQ